jgi:hypothetical protein
VFEGFFNLIGSQPATIITDEQLAIESAINEIKRRGRYKGEHCFDVFHIVKNLLRRVRDK